MAITVVSSVSAMLSAVASANTGDEIHMDNGAKNNSTRTALVSGASGEVIVKSQNLHGAVMTGAPIDINGNNIKFSGFDLQWNNTATDYFVINGDDVTVERCKIHFANVGAGARKWVHYKGNNGIFQFNEVFGKTTPDDMFLAAGNGPITGTKVLHNHLHDFTDVTNVTTSEPIRIGNSDMAMCDFNAEVAFNLIENMDADVEVISVKCTNVNIHHNNIKNCQGSIVLRQARKCFVDSNVIINGGIRVHGEDHKIRNNQIIENSVGGASRSLYISSGDVEEYFVNGDFTGGEAAEGQVIQVNAYEQRAKNCEITGNWFMQNGASNNVIWLLGDDGAADFQPDNNIISNNVIQASNGICTDAVSGTNPADWADQTVAGNRFNLSGSATVGDIGGLGTRYTLEDPHLSRLAGGAYRCAYYLSPLEVGPNGV